MWSTRQVGLSGRDILSPFVHTVGVVHSWLGHNFLKVKLIMESNLSLDEVKAEVYRKVGRCLHLSQAIEGILKFLVPKLEFAGNLKDFEVLSSKQHEKAKKMTLGQLMGLLGEVPVEVEPPADGKHIWVRLSVNLFSGDDERQAFIARATSLVAERNYMVHHLFTGVAATTFEDWLALDQRMSDVWEKIVPEYEYLLGLMDIAKNTGEVMQRFNQSKEWEDILDDIFGKTS